VGKRRRAIRGYILIFARIMNVLLHMISVQENLLTKKGLSVYPYLEEVFDENSYRK
jgi:hypothetical protein